ncbi:FadR/GntR family transcriptional regulator [Rhizobium binxianense]
MAQEKTKPATGSFKPVHPPRTFELVCASVREKLLHGELRPGDKLPPERDLAIQLNVSRNVVREALRSLEIAGIVALRKGVKGGAFVQEGEASRITQALSDLITLNALSPKDLFEARIMILEMIIDHLFKSKKQLDLSGLARVIEETRTATVAGDIPRRIECAREFYHELAALTGNSAIILTVDSQTEVIQTFLRYRVADMPAETLLNSRAEFLAFMRKGDAEAAKSELRAHLTRVHTSLW